MSFKIDTIIIFFKYPGSGYLTFILLHKATVENLLEYLVTYKL